MHTCMHTKKEGRGGEERGREKERGKREREKGGKEEPVALACFSIS